MKVLATAVLLFLTSFSYSQFAIIQDKDSSCNIRSSPITDYSAIPIAAEKHDQVTLNKDSIKIAVMTQRSDKGKYKFSYYVMPLIRLIFKSGVLIMDQLPASFYFFEYEDKVT